MDCPPELAATALQCLARDPADRPASAEALLARLETSAPIGSGRLRRAASRRFLPYALAAAALGALGFGASRLGDGPADLSSRAATAPSVAILPLASLSAEAGDAALADGMTEELIAILSRGGRLRVIASTSVRALQERQLEVRQIAESLRVSHVLEGALQKVGPKLRMQVRLVDAQDGSTRWSATYDREIGDIFAVQDDIARSVVKELRTTLLGENADSAASGRAQVEVDRAARGRSTDAEAYRLYLLARYFLDQLSRESTAKAITYLTQAVQRDPRFASAWVELSVAYVREVGWGWVADDTGFARARAAVERALELEPDLADAHAQISWIQMFHDWNWGSARMSLGRALELAPGSASAIRLSGVLATILGNTSEAIAIFRRALDHDPLSAAAYHSLGFALHAVDDHAGAEEAYRKALELAPQRVGTRSFLAQTLLAQGRVEEAADEARQEPEDGFRLCAVAITAHALGRVAASDAALRELVDKHADLWGLQVAEVHAARGDVDEAFRWLERAFERRDTGLARAKTNPSLRALHDDARWATLLERMGLGDGSAPG